MFSYPLRLALVGLLLSMSSIALADEGAEPGKALNVLIDDFQGQDGRSAIGTAWQGFTDRVMGGLSDMQAGYREVNGKAVLFMRGQVRLENNGGFVQVRLPLADRGSFDARDWDAIRLTVRASPGPYYIHLRTRDTRRPWAYYRAPIPVSEAWQTVDIPFTEFRPESLREELDLSALQSLGLVAYGERFDAELEVERIEFVQLD